MGKVQDTINRIARRRTHNATPAIALIVPSQQKPTKQSFPTTYAEVANWLTEQTSASLQAQITGLTRALQHSNRLQNNAAERLKIAGLFASQVNAVKPFIDDQYVGADLPYSNDARNAFESATTLLQELSYSYKIALVDVLLRRSKLHRLDRIHALYFAMRSLAECSLRFSQSYLPWPDKYWRDINTLYWLAEKESAVDEIVSAATAKDNFYPATIRTLYATLAMFHLSNNDHLPASLMEQLLYTLAQHATHLPFDSELPDTPGNSLYSVAINSANPPAAHRYCNYATEDEIRYLHLQPICEALLSAENTQENNQPFLSRAQLQKILFIWSRQTSRSTARAISNAAVATQTGLKDIHALYRQHESALEQHAAPTRWTLVNRSNSGFCLRGNTRDNHQLQVGELIACIVPDSTALNRPESIRLDSKDAPNSLHTGVIRWIKNLQQDDLQIGIELIGTDVQPVLGEKRTSTERSYEPRFEALTFDIGSDGFTTTLIVLPVDRFRLGDVLKIYPSLNSDICSAFKLTEAISFDGRFDCFRITAVSTKSHNTRPVSVLDQ